MTTHPDTLIVSDYVICATLRKVPDVFNVELAVGADAGRPGGGFSAGSAQAPPPRVPQGRQRKETCYSHVVVRIPERDYVGMTGWTMALGRETLLRELHRLHERESGPPSGRERHDSLSLGSRSGVAAGRGAISVRAGDLSAGRRSEVPLFRIQATAEGQADWREWGSIYPGQRLTLLNGDRRASSFAVAGWPFPGNGESVLLMLRPGAPALVDVVAEPPGSLNAGRRRRGGIRGARPAWPWPCGCGSWRGRPVLESSGALSGTTAPRSRHRWPRPEPATAPAAVFRAADVSRDRSHLAAPDVDYPADRSLGSARAGVGVFPVESMAFGAASLRPDWPTPPPTSARFWSRPRLCASAARTGGRARPALTWIPRRPAAMRAGGRRGLATLVDLRGGRDQRLADQF
jgi:hypothetical protein